MIGRTLSYDHDAMAIKIDCTLETLSKVVILGINQTSRPHYAPCISLDTLKT